MKKNLITRKKAITIIFSILLIIILSAGFYTIYLSSKVNRVEVNRSEVTDTGKEIAKEDADVITVALFGTDYGAASGAADSIMVLSINTKTNEIKLLSLMRDMYLELPAGGKDNLNYTMSNGGPSAILKTINYNFNLNIDKFVSVNLYNLPKVIDALGGVNIDITNEELSIINSSVPSMDLKNGTKTTPLTESGNQLLTGTQASEYSRIRYTDGRENKRTERQRDVLASLFNKFKSIHPTQILPLANDILPLVTTNLTNSEIFSISSKALGMGVNNIQQERFPHDEDSETILTDMYHIIIDQPKTTEKIQKFIYSK